MSERLLARLLFGLGMLAVGVLLLFDGHWSNADPLARLGLVLAMSAAAIGTALDVKHRREDKRHGRDTAGGTE